MSKKKSSSPWVWHREDMPLWSLCWAHCCYWPTHSLDMGATCHLLHLCFGGSWIYGWHCISVSSMGCLVTCNRGSSRRHHPLLTTNHPFIPHSSTENLLELFFGVFFEGTQPNSGCVYHDTSLAPEKARLSRQCHWRGPRSLLGHTTQHPVAGRNRRALSLPIPRRGAWWSMLKPIWQIYEAEQLSLEGTTVPAHSSNISMPPLPTCRQQEADCYDWQHEMTASW